MADRRTPANRRSSRRRAAQDWTHRSRAWIHARLNDLESRLPAAPARRLRAFQGQLRQLEHRIDRMSVAGARRYQRFEYQLRSQLAARIRDLERAIARGGRRSAQA